MLLLNIISCTGGSKPKLCFITFYFQKYTYMALPLLWEIILQIK